MIYRVIQPFRYKDVHQVKKEAIPGTCVDIVTKNDADRLMGNGKIAPINLPNIRKGASIESAHPLARTLRIGIWLYTSSHYSGGRVHLFQYANCMARLGAEVYYMSNTRPIWARDYPTSNIRYLIWGQDNPPDDLDILMTDGKGIASGYASAYRTAHSQAKLIVMNFETPNWVKKFAPKIANKIASGHKELMRGADSLVANSQESAKHLAEWISRPVSDCRVLLPSVNTYAVARSEGVAIPKFLGRPYAVWSARGQKYKGSESAAAAVWKLKKPFDLVSFGTSTCSPHPTTLHTAHKLEQESDVTKYTVMRNAHVTLAPSLFEGFGMVPMESLAVGTPVIAYDLPVLRQEYGDVPGLHLVKHGDAKAFSQKVAEIASKPKPKLNPEPIREKFGLGAMSSRVQDLPWHAVKKTRVTVQMIAYWGFLPESIESVYPYVDEILIACGPEKNAPRIQDGTLERLRALPDPGHKIRIEARKSWGDKRDMRHWCHQHSTGNYSLVLDGDEIWVGFDKWVKAKIAFGAPRWVTLWHDAEHYVIDDPKKPIHRWGKEIEPYGCICSHYRWSILRPSYRWAVHCRLQDASGKPMRIPGDAAAKQVPGCVLYHLGHVLPADVMKAKHKFYRNRDGDDAMRQARQKIWHAWKGQVGNTGDGIVKKIDWKVPDIIQRAVASAKQISVQV